jgi:hypothetical protein
LPQEVLVLAPSQDAFVASAAPEASSGADRSLYAGTNLDPKLNPRTYRSLIEVELDGALPPGAELERAMLRLYQHAAAPGGASDSQTAILLPVTAAWSEATTTWVNQPGVATDLAAAAAPGPAR